MNGSSKSTRRRMLRASASFGEPCSPGATLRQSKAIRAGSEYR
jgi:hypothetical protein